MRTQIGFGFAVLLTAACSADAFTSGDAGSNGGDGGTVPVTGGGNPDGGSLPPKGCDVSKLPTDDVCVVNDAEGVFVSTSFGSLAGDGTQALPLLSLDAAIALAKKTHKRVYACAESYAEQVHLQESTDVFGYFTCNAGWAVGSKHAVVRAPASPAVVASNIIAATRVEALDIVAPDFADKSQSSIALIATGSSGLTIKNAAIHAGTGGKGDIGTDGIQLTDSGSVKNGGGAKAEGAGANYLFLANLYGNPSQAGTNACVGETGHDPGPGGSGGHGGSVQSQMFVSWTWVAVGNATSAGSPAVPTTQTAQGGAINGGAGAAGAAGANGMAGQIAASIGTLGQSGYTPADGSSGTAGSPGQGGGGSGGSYLPWSDYSPASYQGQFGWGEAGAGGGAGGCPGLPGAAGKGGGASVAVIAVSGALTFDGVTIESSAAGAGGSAGLGSQPTSGGTGGYYIKHTSNAGSGGSGGLSGVSGNGSGGPSIAIAYQGAKPQLVGTTVTAGAGGSGVMSRVGTDGQTVPASPSGISSASYAF